MLMVVIIVTATAGHVPPPLPQHGIRLFGELTAAARRPPACHHHTRIGLRRSGNWVADVAAGHLIGATTIEEVGADCPAPPYRYVP